MMKKFFKSLVSLSPLSLTIGMTFVVLILFLRGIPFLDLIELKTYDLRLLSRGIKKTSPDVVLAVIDEKSLDTIGKWPWPRSKIGTLIDLLSQDGAKVIGFDIGFWEPDENTNLELIRGLEQEIRSLQIQNQQLDRYLGDMKINADNDLSFANAIKKSKTKIVLGHFFHMSKYSLGYKIDQEQIDNQLKRISNSIYPLIRYEERGVDIGDFLTEFTAYVPEANLDILSKEADSSGYFNMVPDMDGIFRKIPLVVKSGEEIYSPLSLQTVWHYLDKPQLTLRVSLYGIEGIRLGDRFIPTDENGRMLINYRGPEKTFPHYSISDIFQNKLPKGTFNDKIVLIGSAAIGLGDIRNTPLSSTGAYPGLEIHATVIDNILKKDFLHKPKWATIYDVLAIIILSLLTGIALPRLSALKGILCAAVLFVSHILISRWLFVNSGLWINIVYPLLALALVYTSVTVFHYLVEEKNKRFLHATFSSYLSPELIEEMVSSETMPELGGEARTVTAYFTDIQGFSTFSEKLTAPQLVELLNEYLTAMTDILIAEQGTLDKYEGDAIIAFLGAPMDIPDHALKGCRVAISMQDALLELCNKWKNEKQFPEEPNRNIKNLSPEEWAQGGKWPKIVHNMKMRIGVNSGEIVVGNMGSTTRMNYTMMGDAVNLAARLEEGAKQFGIYTAVSEYTMNAEYTNENGEQEKIMNAVEARFIDNITVVGKSEPVTVYELCAMKGGLSGQEKELFGIFNKGMQHYLNMEWDPAIALFGESLKIERIPDGITTPSEVFIKRCEEFKENPPVPPGEKWDGVYRMTKK